MESRSATRERSTSACEVGTDLTARRRLPVAGVASLTVLFGNGGCVRDAQAVAGNQAVLHGTVVDTAGTGGVPPTRIIHGRRQGTRRG